MGWSSIPCSIYRGGTSKSLLLRGRDLPTDPRLRDKIILHLFGSPDLKQIDGLGGATPTTSKLGIVDVSSRPGIDVDFTFGQVSIDKPYIDYKPNCGNVSSAVGPFAVEQEMVPVTQDGMITVRIYNTNTNSVIVSRFMVKDQHFDADGDTRIPGVPTTGSPIYLDFHDPGGGATGKLFPTGNRSDIIRVPGGGTYRVTVIDAGNLTVLMDGDELHLKGTEVDEKSIAHALPIMETVRQQVGRMLGIFQPDEIVRPATHALPKVALIQQPRDYQTTSQEFIQQQDYEISARVLSMGRLHPTYAVTGGMALALSAKFSNTISYEKCSPDSRRSNRLRIGHPAGILEMAAEVAEQPECKAVKVTLIRTARPLISGQAWIPSFGEVIS